MIFYTDPKSPIRQAGTLYEGEALGLALTNTVYALDVSTIDLCLSLFD